MIDHKPLENVEYFNYLGSMTTNYIRCTCETKSRTAMAKAACNNRKTVFTSKLESVKCYTCSITLYGAESCDTSENRSETPGKLWNVVPDQLDWSCVKWSTTKEQGEKEYPANKNKERRSHLVYRNCPLQHVIEGNKVVRTEVTGRQEKLLDGLKEKRW
jgi:ribosomal protein S27E